VVFVYDIIWFMAERDDLTAIVERLKAIEKILSEYVATIYSAEKRDRELEGCPQLVRAEITFDDTSKREAQGEAARQYGTQSSISRATWAAFAAAFLYAGLAAIQLNEMHTQTAQVFSQSDVENANASRRTVEVFQQLEIAQQQAGAAQKSVEAIQKQMRVDQQARISVEVGLNTALQLNGMVGAGLRYTNTGKTVARNILIKSVVTIAPEKQELLFRYPSDLVNTFRIGAVYPMSSSPVQARMYDPGHIGHSIKKEEYEALQEYRSHGLVYGKISYDDVFGGHHWNTFCNMSQLRDPVSDMPKACVAYNTTDKN
jgi:hypothetical protein